MSERRTQTLLFTLIVAVALLGAYLVGVNQSNPAEAADPPAADGVRGFSAPGVGSVDAVPDQLGFSISVTSQAGDSVAAMNMTSARITSVRKALVAEGVARKDIRTTNVGVAPTYRYDDGRTIPTGFRSTQGLRVLVRDLPSAGKVLSRAAVAIDDQGQISNVTMEIGDKKELLAQAREQAVEDSRHAAEAYAASSGLDVGALQYVEEATDTSRVAEAFRGSMDAANLDSLAANAVPIEAGEQQVTVRVKVRWALA